MDLKTEFAQIDNDQLLMMSRSIGAFVFVWHGEGEPTRYEMRRVNQELARRMAELNYEPQPA